MMEKNCIPIPSKRGRMEKITKDARAFDWTEPIVKKQTGNMQELGEKIFSVIQDVVTRKG